MQLGALLSGLTALLSTAVLAQDTTCHNYVLISIRGTYEVQGRSIAFTTMINNTLNVIPGGLEYDAVYPASPNQTAYLGADDVTRYIKAGLKKCPRQKYALLGYSQGATAAMLTLANITNPSTKIYKSIKAVIVVGNPYHVPKAKVNVDEFNGTSTRKYHGALYDATKANASGIAKIYYKNGKLLDICHTEDAVCAPDYPNATFSPGHLHYGDTNVQDLGARFLIYHLSSGDRKSSPIKSTSTKKPSSATTSCS